MDSNFIKPLDSFVDEVIGYLPDYLRKDNLVKFMTIFLDRLEALDLSFIQLAEYRLLVNAQGVVLDDIKKEVKSKQKEINYSSSESSSSKSSSKSSSESESQS